MQLGWRWLRVHAAVICEDSSTTLHVYALQSPSPAPFLCIPLLSSFLPSSSSSPVAAPPVVLVPGLRSVDNCTFLFRGSRLPCSCPPPTPFLPSEIPETVLLSIRDKDAAAAWQVTFSCPPHTSSPTFVSALSPVSVFASCSQCLVMHCAGCAPIVAAAGKRRVVAR
jgi:hypothetical protein